MTAAAKPPVDAPSANAATPRTSTPGAPGPTGNAKTSQGDPANHAHSAKRAKVRATVAGWGLVAPSLFGVAAFLLLPIVVVLWLSMQRWDLISDPTWVGLQNWQRVLADNSFWKSMLVTLGFVVIVIPVQTLLGLWIANLLTKGLPGSALMRVIYVLPWVCAPLALGVVWNWIFQPTGGALNELLGTHVQWLSDPAFALPSVAAVTIWSQVGYVSLFFMAGLAVIPSQVIEAARIDGASPTRIFWSIKIPLLRPTMFFVLVTSIISSFQIFDTVYGLTPQGGPGGSTSVIAFKLYQTAFRNYDVGAASVIAVILFVLLVLITLVQHTYFRKRMTYDLS
ncbi:multiple sugar transport system permease protein [Leucobacter exalbidus]|uniref:Multiple sugar transport system permease protein n=1 Tax=Leucobacter exalbidus TaxID=662960 RepID=A0A940PLL0_9MICO|nr:sugar ABC transporter permease [Leucobacter exalbidus]MBP1325328.1 multiple sugar transport system permease protein [Leucobacter exalbidus]